MASSRSLLAALALLFGAQGAQALDPQAPVLVSVRWDTGAPFAGVCGGPSFSANNRFLAFGCQAGDLVPGDNNNRTDSFVLDRQTGVIERVSVSSTGQEMPYNSLGGFAADSGLLVAFPASGPLHPDYGPPPPLDFGHTAVYLRRRATGETDLITRDAFGQALTSSVSLYDANFSRSEILINYPGDIRTGPHASIFTIAAQMWVKNWMTGAVELISPTLGGELSNGAAYLGNFSSTGRYIVFTSSGDDLGPPARPGDENLYLRDRVTGTIERLTWPWSGGEFQAPLDVGPTPPRISTNGRFVVFSSTSTELHPDTATASGTRVYLLDRQTGQLDHLSPTPGYSSFNTNVDMSADGRYIAWATRNFSFQGPPNPPADMRAIWVLDRLTGQRVNVTEPLGPLWDDAVVTLALSPDGSMIAFSWRIADPTSPVFARPLLYTVQLRGEPPPPPSPVPARSPWWLALLGAAVLMIAAKRLRRTRTAAQSER